MRHLFWPLVAVIVILVVLDTFAGGALSVPLVSFLGYALFGWTGFIPRMGKLISWRWEMFWSVIIYASMLLVGGHLFVRWLYRQMHSGHDAVVCPRWKFGWSVRFLVLLIVMFCAGTACIAIVHQSTWLATSPERLFGSERAQRVRCSNNLRQIGQGLVLYANDHQGKLPDDFSTLITDADINPEVFVCPAGADEKAPGATPKEMAANFMSGRHCSYVYLGKGLSLPVNADVVLIYERPGNHDGDGMNVLFGDMHAEWFNPVRMQQLLQKIETTSGRPTTWPVDAP